MNWAALMKEAYAIYMAMRKLSFYITDAEVTIKCDHLPLKNFLQKQTLNTKVNNWAVELEKFNLKLEWIQGVKNMFCFKNVSEISEISPDFWKPLKDQVEHLEITYEEGNLKEVHLPLTTKQKIQLQKNDTQARDIVNELQKEKDNVKMFILHNGVLCRLWTEERETYRCTFVPEVLRDPLLVLAHNQNGHNGGRCMYMALKKMYYWPGMKSEIFKHCKTCKECMLKN